MMELGAESWVSLPQHNSPWFGLRGGSWYDFGPDDIGGGGVTARVMCERRGSGRCVRRWSHGLVASAAVSLK